MHLFFPFKKATHPQKRYLYAITTGTFAGELLTYIEDDAESFMFLSMPKMIIRDIPKNTFTGGISGGIVDVVEKMPTAVYKICVAQYKKLKNGK